MKVTTDIDIDFANRDAALVGLMNIPAALADHTRHQTGVYFQNIPTDPISGYASLDHKQAAEHGYFKIDFLNNSVYDGIRDEDHLITLLDREPEWDMFEHQAIVSRLIHIYNSFGIVSAVKPTCIEDLAVILALQRPGKRHLLGKPREQIDAEIWKPDATGFVFKRAHAIAYAVSIVVQLNLICEQTNDAIDASRDPFDA